MDLANGRRPRSREGIGLNGWAIKPLRFGELVATSAATSLAYRGMFPPKHREIDRRNARFPDGRLGVTIFGCRGRWFKSTRPDLTEGGHGGWWRLVKVSGGTTQPPPTSTVLHQPPQPAVRLAPVAQLDRASASGATLCTREHGDMLPLRAQDTPVCRIVPHRMANNGKRKRDGWLRPNRAVMRRVNERCLRA